MRRFLDHYAITGGLSGLLALSSPIDALASGVTGAWSAEVELPWPWPFAGALHRALRVTSDGMAIFSPAAAPAGGYLPALDDAGDDIFLAPWAAAMSTAANGVRYEEIDASTFVVDWDVNAHWDTGSGYNRIRFQLVLVDDGSFAFRYSVVGSFGTPPASSPAQTGAHAAGGEFRSPLPDELAAGGSTSSPPGTLDYDSSDYPSTGWTWTPSASAVVLPDGSHRLRAVSALPWTTDQLDPSEWSLSTTADVVVPRVVATSAVDDVGEGHAEIRLDLDVRLRPGVSYSVGVPAPAGPTPGALSVAGLAPGVSTVTGGALVLPDIAGPLVGEGKGAWLVDDGADYALTGGADTVEAAIWAVLLTPKGALYWDPTFGDLPTLKSPARDLRNAQSRLARRVERVPGVDRATVQLLWDRTVRHMVVSVRAQTSVGIIDTQRSA